MKCQMCKKRGRRLAECSKCNMGLFLCFRCLAIHLCLEWEKVPVQLE